MKSNKLLETKNMAYKFKDAADAMVIEEMECGKGKRIQFTPFSSCLGVVCRKGNLLTGIHLVEVDKQKEFFNDEKAIAVKNKINGCDEWFFIGFVTDWENGYKKQINIIKAVPKQKKSVNGGDGVYGAKWEFNELAYLKAPMYKKLS